MVTIMTPNDNGYDNDTFQDGIALISGLYFKHVTIVNDASRVISECCHNLEHHSRVFDYDPRGAIYAHL